MKLSHHYRDAPSRPDVEPYCFASNAARDFANIDEGIAAGKATAKAAYPNAHSFLIADENLRTRAICTLVEGKWSTELDPLV